MSENQTGDKTHFGYKTVDSRDKERLVANVFHSVASRYDLMNDLMSMGIHRLWKRFTLEMSAARRGQKVLDIAGGTGDLALKFAEIVGGPKGRLFSPISMIPCCMLGATNSLIKV